LSPSEIGKEAAQQVRSAAPGNVNILTDFATPLPPVMMDRGQMRQIFTSLILNGAEAIGDRPRGTVIVATSPAGDFVRIAVLDNGSGMDDAVKRQMFEPFFTTKFVGRGLGLAAVDGIVRQLGGRIEVDSQTGRGTCVEVYLPAFHMAPDNGGAVLIVGEPSVRAAIGTFLREQGISYFEASTGPEAVERIKSHSRSIRALVFDESAAAMKVQKCCRKSWPFSPTCR